MGSEDSRARYGGRSRADSFLDLVARALGNAADVGEGNNQRGYTLSLVPVSSTDSTPELIVPHSKSVRPRLHLHAARTSEPQELVLGRNSRTRIADLEVSRTLCVIRFDGKEGRAWIRIKKPRGMHYVTLNGVVVHAYTTDTAGGADVESAGIENDHGMEIFDGQRLALLGNRYAYRVGIEKVKGMVARCNSQRAIVPVVTRERGDVTGGGDEATMMETCGHILKFLQEKDSKAWNFFAKPVDPILEGVPEYHQVIKKPMDLGTIQQMMDADELRSAEEFARLVRLVFENAMTVNTDSSHVVHKAAKSLLIVFNQRFREVERMMNPSLGENREDQQRINVESRETPNEDTRKKKKSSRNAKRKEGASTREARGRKREKKTKRRKTQKDAELCATEKRKLDQERKGRAAIQLAAATYHPPSAGSNVTGTGVPTPHQVRAPISVAGNRSVTSEGSSAFVSTVVASRRNAARTTASNAASGFGSNIMEVRKELEQKNKALEAERQKTHALREAKSRHEQEIERLRAALDEKNAEVNRLRELAVRNVEAWEANAEETAQLARSKAEEARQAVLGVQRTIVASAPTPASVQQLVPRLRGGAELVTSMPVTEAVQIIPM